MDVDVLQEQKRVLDTDPRQLLQTEAVILQGVTKCYGSFRAVDHLHLGIKTAECFGLLGVNGAGKTSTFKMLTGDESISRGQAIVKGCDVKTQIKKVCKLESLK